MNRDFHFRDKIGVGVDQSSRIFYDRLLQRIERHPWFQVAALDTCQLLFTQDSARAAPAANCAIQLSDAGRPLLAPDVNGADLDMLREQPAGSPAVIGAPLHASLGLALALQPLHQLFELEAVHVTALLPTFGSPPPRASIELLDNVLPAAVAVRQRLERELRQLLRAPAMFMSVQCVEVPVSEGPLLCVAVKLRQSASREDLIAAWNNSKGFPDRERLPSGREQPVFYQEEASFPQARRQSASASIGQLSTCSPADYTFMVVAPDPIGSLLLTAETLVVAGLLYW